MADLSDVEEALLRLAAAVLYPEGPAAPSVIGRACRLYRGWPRGAALDADLAAGLAHVTVFPEARPQAVTTRYPDRWEKVGMPAPGLNVPGLSVPGLSVIVDGRSATVEGSAHVGQVAGLLVDGMAVVHRTAPGDTAEMVAAVLATYLRARRVVTVDGATLTVAGSGPMLGRVVADRMVRRETRRQRQVLRLTVWCPDADMRDRLASALDAQLSTVDFLDLPDGGKGRLLFRGSLVHDQGRAARLFRRDLLYAVDYATTVTQTLPAMIFGDMRLGAHSVIG
jgi:hypothetical protein